MTDRTEKFDKALSAASNVTAERGAVYGHPYDDFDRAARLKDVTAELDDARIGHVLDMICTKIARLIHSPDHLDSWIDIAGYARTAVMVLDERDKRHPKPRFTEGELKETLQSLGVDREPLSFWRNRSEAGTIHSVVGYCRTCGQLGGSHAEWCVPIEEDPKLLLSWKNRIKPNTSIFNARNTPDDPCDVCGSTHVCYLWCAAAYHTEED